MKTRLLLALFICSMVVNNTSAQMPNYDGAPLEFDYGHQKPYGANSPW